MKKKVLILFLIVLFGCAKHQKEGKEFSFAGTTMGTTYSVKIIDLKDEIHSTFKIKIDSVLANVNNEMSTYIETSKLSKFNSFKDTTWFETTKELSAVLNKAIDIAKLTNKSFDITVGPLVNLWGFGPVKTHNKIPTNEDILNLLQDVGIDYLLVDVQNSKIRKLKPNLYCDLSAIAKGYGVDKLAEFFLSSDINNFMIEVGGEIRTSGKNKQEESWRIGISNVNNSDLQKIVGLSNYSMATSGDYLNYFEKNGTRYSHTIDSRTGKPITHKLASVTVIHKNCSYADAFATAINVMGPEEGYNFALNKKLPIFMIIRKENSFIEKSTPQFNKFINNN
jgi:thiamine biosynthesis lipoprotein